MTDNPLMGGPPKGGKVTVEMLEAMVVKYNNMPHFARENRPWFVNKRTKEDGTIVRFLDRASGPPSDVR